MDKSKLRNGMVVRLRNDSLWFVLNNKLIGKSSFIGLEDYTTDLRNNFNVKGDYDIVKVYVTSANMIHNLLDEDKLTYIWRRDREVDWSKVPKFTKVQVKQTKEDKWKNAYFISFENKNNYGYITTFCDEFTFRDLKQEKT